MTDTTEDTAGMSEAELARHSEKMAKKKHAREKIMATKTDEKGLVIVHTGKGKGKSTAGFGMIFRHIAHKKPCAVVQFIKGAFEIAATVDFMFAFAATTGAVKDHHFEAAYNAYLRDERGRDFLMQKNPAALAEMAARFAEAIDRKRWTPRSNSARYELDTIGKRRAS